MAILDTGRITKEKLIRQSFANLWNLIVDQDNVPLPSGLPSDHKYVYRRLPKVLSKNFNGFPFIVVSRARPKKQGGTVSLTKQFTDYEFMVSVYTQDRRSDSSGNPNGADQNDEISDSIRTTLDNVTNRKSLLFNGMANLVYDVETDETDLEETAFFVYITNFDIRFEKNLQVTG